MMDSKEAHCTIKCLDDGPYIVTDLKVLADAGGAAFPVKSSTALCRCGSSSTKPYCDGTHAKIEFKSAKNSNRTADKSTTYPGKRIAIHDNRSLCAHAGLCTNRLPTVWRLNEEPWIDPDAVDVEAIIDVIKQCPSGALSYSLEKDERTEDQRAESVQLSADGPYKVVGSIALAGQKWGERASREHYTLCRCGASKNKPFCDGSHWEAEFKDDTRSTT